MPEPLKIWFRFTHTLEGCRIAGLHINADDITRIAVHRVPQPAVSTQASRMSERRLDGVGFQAFFSVAMMLAAWFSPRLFRQARGCLIWRRSLGVFRDPLAFYLFGRPAARTGRLRAVCHGRPGARPLTVRHR